VILTRLLRQESLVPGYGRRHPRALPEAATVGAVRIVIDQFSGQSRSAGFVEMATREEAVEAVTMLSGHYSRDPQPQRGCARTARAEAAPTGQLAGTIARAAPLPPDHF
jgi:hypothetical protein